MLRAQDLCPGKGATAWRVPSYPQDDDIIVQAVRLLWDHIEEYRVVSHNPTPAGAKPGNHEHHMTQKLETPVQCVLLPTFLTGNFPRWIPDTSCKALRLKPFVLHDHFYLLSFFNLIHFMACQASGRDSRQALKNVL
jgi:hypothetical protein